MSKEEELKEKSKMSLDEMFKEESPEEKIVDVKDIQRPRFPNKISWYLTDDNYRDYNDFFSWRLFSGVTKTKAELQNEIIEFFMHHHKNKLKKEINKRFVK